MQRVRRCIKGRLSIIFKVSRLKCAYMARDRDETAVIIAYLTIGIRSRGEAQLIYWLTAFDQMAVIK
jgi:hypothetical protein